MQVYKATCRLGLPAIILAKETGQNLAQKVTLTVEIFFEQRYNLVIPDITQAIQLANAC